MSLMFSWKETHMIRYYLFSLYRDLDIAQVEMGRLIDEDPLSPEVQNWDSTVEFLKEEIEEVARHNPGIH
jgi:hypothetical protein